MCYIYYYYHPEPDLCSSYITSSWLLDVLLLERNKTCRRDGGTTRKIQSPPRLFLVMFSTTKLFIPASFLFQRAGRILEHLIIESLSPQTTYNTMSDAANRPPPFSQPSRLRCLCFRLGFANCVHSSRVLPCRVESVLLGSTYQIADLAASGQKMRCS